MVLLVIIHRVRKEHIMVDVVAVTLINIEGKIIIEKVTKIRIWVDFRVFLCKD